MNNTTYHLERLRHHGLKEIPVGREVQAYFCFRPSTTTDAFNLVVFKGVIYMSSPDHGALTLLPFAPDALEWLDHNVHDTEALMDAIPQNMLELITGERERDDGTIEVVHHDSIDFFLGALTRFQQLRRRAS